MPEAFDPFEWVSLKEFGGFTRGANLRAEAMEEETGKQWQYIAKHSDILKSLAEGQKRFAEYEKQQAARVLALTLKKQELETAVDKAEARLAAVEGSLLALQQAVFPLRPRAVKPE